MKFIRIFNRSLACELEVSDTAPLKGSTHVRSIRWTGGQPTTEDIEEFTQWMHTLNEQCSNQWNAEIFYVFEPEQNRWEIWCYTPGQPPRILTREEIQEIREADDRPGGAS